MEVFVGYRLKIFGTNQSLEPIFSLKNIIDIKISNYNDKDKEALSTFKKSIWKKMVLSNF